MQGSLQKIKYDKNSIYLFLNQADLIKKEDLIKTIAKLDF